MANYANDSTDRLSENANEGGGVQNPENFANVINGCPLTVPYVQQGGFTLF